MEPVIVGGGPAGCAAAIALARAGGTPTVIDREAAPGDALCGGFLSWRTAARLRALGIDPVSLGAHAVSRLGLFAGRHHADLPLPACGYGLSRRALDGALRKEAANAGARFVTDTVRAIVGRSVIGRAREWHGEGVFLATGKHDLRGLPRPRVARDPALGLRLRLPATGTRHGLLAGRIELHLFAGGYAGIVLQEDGTINVCLAVRKARLAAAGGSPARLLGGLADGNPHLAARLGEDWRAQCPDSIGAVPYGFVARRTEPGLFRLGDQAAVIPSLAGEGIAIALASGDMAARHWLGGGAEAAAPYQRDFAANVAGPVRAASLAWTLAERRAFAPFAVAAARRVPPLADWLMRATRLPAAPSLAPARARP